jgi:hypothetical protein
MSTVRGRTARTTAGLERTRDRSREARHQGVAHERLVRATDHGLVQARTEHLTPSGCRLRALPGGRVEQVYRHRQPLGLVGA